MDESQRSMLEKLLDDIELGKPIHKAVKPELKLETSQKSFVNSKKISGSPTTL